MTKGKYLQLAGGPHHQLLWQGVGKVGGNKDGGNEATKQKTRHPALGEENLQRMEATDCVPLILFLIARRAGKINCHSP